MLKKWRIFLQLDAYFCRLKIRMPLFESDISTTVLPVSINDLNDRYFAGESLSAEELCAIQNYNRLRLTYLNSAEDGKEFDQRYLEMQAKANLSDYREFLDIKI